uniref:Uncharacterized protein n=1 Tax=Macrostomum lignano TaxID=282301 RepID=A0A1I8GHV5_9PLAT
MSAERLGKQRHQCADPDRQRLPSSQCSRRHNSKRKFHAIDIFPDCPDFS